MLLSGSLFFLGGALTQKYVGNADEDATGAAGAPTGFPGGGQLPEGFSIPGGGIPEPESSAPREDETDSVIGTVVAVRGDRWVVEDLGGTRHRVRITNDVDVTRETTVAPGRVTKGQRVDISGTTSAGLLRAEDVTVR